VSKRGKRGGYDDGYADPTATQAINNVTRGERRRERAARARETWGMVTRESRVQPRRATE
jgi:hypothetical protein